MPHEETRRVVHILQGKRKRSGCTHQRSRTCLSPDRIREVYAATALAGRAHASRSPDTVKGEVYAATKGCAHVARQTQTGVFGSGVLNDAWSTRR